MVHGQLIAAGKTEKLTYRQLRALERMDAKKARLHDETELAKEAIVAGGRAAQGALTNQISGTILVVLGLFVLAPEWLPLTALATKTISDAIKGVDYSPPTKTTEYHLPGATVAITPLAPNGIAIIPPAPPPPPTQTSVTQYAIVDGPFDTQYEATLSFYGHIVEYTIAHPFGTTHVAAAHYKVEQGTDGKFYVTDTTTPGDQPAQNP